MTADEIRKRKEQLDAAEPFAALAEIAGAMRVHLEFVQNGAEKVADALLYARHPYALDDGLTTVREHILDDYAKLRDELHAAVDRVMRAAIMDKPSEPAPKAEPVEREP